MRNRKQKRNKKVERRKFRAKKTLKALRRNESKEMKNETRRR